MFTNEISIVTPSYHIDYEACRLLVESINRHVPAEIRHYIIVPKADYHLFKKLETERSQIKFQEDFLPWWIVPSLISKKWYFSFKTFPVRGWIRQQIVKLATGNMLAEDNFLIIDSDTFFVKSFNFKSFLRNGDLSLYCEPLDTPIPSHEKWQENSTKMFKIDPPKLLPEIYVGPFIFWRREVLQKMFKSLENLNGCSWQKTICRQLSVSEYTVYGVFVRQVLGLSKSAHYTDPCKYTHDYYKEIALSKKELIEFRDSIKDHHIGVSISSKSFTPIALIREVYGYPDADV